MRFLNHPITGLLTLSTLAALMAGCANEADRQRATLREQNLARRTEIVRAMLPKLKPGMSIEAVQTLVGVSMFCSGATRCTDSYFAESNCSATFTYDQLGEVKCPPPAASALTTKVKFPLPADWELKPLNAAMLKNNAVIYAANDRINCALLGYATPRASIFDIRVYAEAQRDALIRQLKGANSTDIAAGDIGGNPILQFSVVGTASGMVRDTVLHYQNTIIYGREEVVMTRIWCRPQDFQSNSEAMRLLAISPTGM